MRSWPILILLLCAHCTPGEKLTILWAALQAAHDLGAGLLEASGALEVDPADLLASPCFTNFENCDHAGLKLHISNQTCPPNFPVTTMSRSPSPSRSTTGTFSPDPIPLS